MKCLRSVKACAVLDKFRNEDIRKELKVFRIKDKTQKYRQDWLNRDRRMPCTRLPRAALYYNLRGKRYRGRSGSVGLTKKLEQAYKAYPLK